MNRETQSTFAQLETTTQIGFEDNPFIIAPILLLRMRRAKSRVEQMELSGKFHPYIVFAIPTLIEESIMKRVSVRDLLENYYNYSPPKDK